MIPKQAVIKVRCLHRVSLISKVPIHLLQFASVCLLFSSVSRSNFVVGLGSHDKGRFDHRSFRNNCVLSFLLHSARACFSVVGSHRSCDVLAYNFLLITEDCINTLLSPCFVYYLAPFSSRIVCLSDSDVDDNDSSKSSKKQKISPRAKSNLKPRSSFKNSVSSKRATPSSEGDKPMDSKSEAGAPKPKPKRRKLVPRKGARKQKAIESIDLSDDTSVNARLQGPNVGVEKLERPVVSLPSSPTLSPSAALATREPRRKRGRSQPLSPTRSSDLSLSSPPSRSDESSSPIPLTLSAFAFQVKGEQLCAKSESPKAKEIKEASFSNPLPKDSANVLNSENSIEPIPSNTLKRSVFAQKRSKLKLKPEHTENDALSEASASSSSRSMRRSKRNRPKISRYAPPPPVEDCGVDSLFISPSSGTIDSSAQSVSPFDDEKVCR